MRYTKFHTNVYLNTKKYGGPVHRVPEISYKSVFEYNKLGLASP